MKWLSRPLVLAAFGAFLTVANVMPATQSMVAGSGPLQFGFGGEPPPLTPGLTLTWNTFLGGADSDYGAAAAVDASGNVYVIGTSNVSWGSPIRPWAGPADAFLAKVDTNGVLLWSTFLGGVGSDYGAAATVDASGNVYVIGTSYVAWGSPIRSWTGPADAFLAKLDANGALLWSTFLGGAGGDAGSAIAVDAGGSAYVIGSSGATWGAPIREWAGSSDAFVAKLDAAGGLLWNTFLGRVGDDSGSGIALDASSNAYVTGLSWGTWGTPIRPWAGWSDAFVARLDSSGGLTWNTFLGGAESEGGTGIASDASGTVYVVGYSNAPWGNPVRPFSSTHVWWDDAFVARLDAGGSLVWNTFLGGDGYDRDSAIGVDASGSVVVSGTSQGTWGDPIRPWSGDADSFVAKLDAGGVLTANTFLGGLYPEVAAGIAVGASGDVYVTGTGEGWWGAPIRQYGGGYRDVFVAKLGDGAIAPSDHVLNDFEGDGRSDIACYDPSFGKWYGYNSGNGPWQTHFGSAGTIPVSGDFDGDGKSDIAVYDPATGGWRIFKSSEGLLETRFGFPGTIPVVGDFDGDGRDDIGCYFAPGGNWFLFKSTEGFWQATFGFEGTIPVVGDFDGDGRDDIGCYYASAGKWYVFKSTEGFWQTTFGYVGTIPVVGDFDGDGRDDIGCYHPRGGNWYVFKSTEGFWQTVFGYLGTEPVVGDFDGDGKSDLGCYYPIGGNWYVFKSTEGFWETQFGYEGTIPLGGTLR